MKVYTTKIHDMLEYVRLRPNMWINKKSITSLEIFITGYMVLGEWGFEDWGKIYNEGEVDLNEFRFWIHGIPNIPLSQGPSFSQYLLDQSSGDEELAFDLFFDLLDKFKELKNSQVN